MSAREGSLAARRHRITLMGEESHVGAGGRRHITSPVIGYVWAEISPVDTNLAERAGREYQPGTITATCHFSPPYAAARRLIWRGATYRIKQAQHQHSIPAETLRFTASLMDGDGVQSEGEGA